MSNKKVKVFVDAIESIEASIKDLNDDKSAQYKDAKDADINVKALRRVISIRRKGVAKHEEEEAIVESYLSELR